MMLHKPIQVRNLELSFPHKICFEGFNAQIDCGMRIGIIGRNGAGKSTLLKILQGMVEATNGDIKIPEDVVFGYVPQVVDEFDNLSGGERLNAAMTQALNLKPNVLLLDEPTNHLDCRQRKGLLHMLTAYAGTLIVVSHDKELLDSCINILWHIDNEKIHVFKGHYDDYLREIAINRTVVEREIIKLDRQKKEMHHALMKEQKRASGSRAKGEKNIDRHKWPTIVSKTKALRAEETFGSKKSAIGQKKRSLVERLSDLRLPEVIRPKFSLQNGEVRDRAIVSISDGSVAYLRNKPILENISLLVSSRTRIAIMGENGSGKSTLVKALLGDSLITRTGKWYHPKREEIGYLDQHYGTLSPNKTPLEIVSELVPNWSHTQLRMFLGDFLFRKNEEVNTVVAQLSGGEKARLSLAQIAAKTPKLLILDEVTNNLDLETRGHMIDVLVAYPGAIIIISHDRYFLDEVGIEERYKIESGVLRNQYEN